MFYSVTICSLIFFICNLEELFEGRPGLRYFCPCGVLQRARHLYSFIFSQKNISFRSVCPSSRLTLASLAHIWVSKQDGNEPQTRMECARVTIVFSLMHKVPIPPTKCRNPKTEHRIEIYLNISDYM